MIPGIISNKNSHPLVECGDFPVSNEVNNKMISFCLIYKYPRFFYLFIKTVYFCPFMQRINRYKPQNKQYVQCFLSNETTIQ